MDIKEIIAKWVREARLAAGLSGDQLAARLAVELGTTRGHSKANISHWENARHQPSLAQLAAISHITRTPLPAELKLNAVKEQVDRAESDKATSTNSSYGRRATDVLGGTRVEVIDDEEENFDAVQIRRVKLRLSAGISGFSVDPEEEDDNPIWFRKRWLESRGYDKNHLIAIRVKGQSMEPGLYEGDTVVIDTRDIQPKDGAVFAVNYEGEAVIKRIVREIGFWWLVSDNQDQRRYPRKRCEGDACIPIGRVIHKQSEHI